MIVRTSSYVANHQTGGSTLGRARFYNQSGAQVFFADPASAYKAVPVAGGWSPSGACAPADAAPPAPH